MSIFEISRGSGPKWTWTVCVYLLLIIRLFTGPVVIDNVRYLPLCPEPKGQFTPIIFSHNSSQKCHQKLTWFDRQIVKKRPSKNLSKGQLTFSWSEDNHTLVLIFIYKLVQLIKKQQTVNQSARRHSNLFFDSLPIPPRGLSASAVELTASL